MKVVIPSRGRSKRIKEQGLKIFPDAVVCVDEREMEDYARAGITNLLAHPSTEDSLTKIRNWIMLNVEDETIVQADDGIVALYVMTNKNNAYIRNPDDIMQVLLNAEAVAKGFGAHLFGFNQSADVKSYSPFEPFKLNAWVGSVVGMIGKTVKWDTFFRLRGDVDCSLQHILTHRIILTDKRFHFLSEDRLKANGGNSHQRSKERDDNEKRMLKSKWGKYIHFGKRVGSSGGGIAMTSSIDVKRRQWRMSKGD